MPIGDPPPVTLPQSVFDVLNACVWDDTNRTFATGAMRYYLFVELDTGCCARWKHGTSTEGAANPRAEIPELTADIITGGTYNTQTKKVSYNNSSYVFRLERETNGTYIAKAVTA